MVQRSAGGVRRAGKLAPHRRKLSGTPECVPRAAGNFPIFPKACAREQEGFRRARNLAAMRRKLSGSDIQLFMDEGNYPRREKIERFPGATLKLPAPQAVLF